jgi:hypothetical protein
MSCQKNVFDNLDHHPIFVQYKKNFINLFLLYRMKKIREKKKIKIKSWVLLGAGPKVV